MIVSRPILLLDRISRHRWAVAVQRGFLLCFPLVIIGAITLILGDIRLPAGDGWQAVATARPVCALVADASLGIIALCLVVTISYSLAAQRGAGDHVELPPVVAAVVALISFMILATPADAKFGMTMFGKHYVLPAIFVAIISTELFTKLMRVRCLHMQHVFDDGDPLLPVVLRSIVSSVAVVSVFLVLQQMLGWLGQPAASLLSESTEALFRPIESPLLRALLFIVLDHLLWFVGAHGNNILSAAEQHYLVAATVANAASIGAGRVPTEIVTKPFLDMFVFMGGSGTSLGLIMAILLDWRGCSQHRLARLGLLPAMFNVSELIVFGLPIVFNPLFLVPFVVAPLVLVLTSYAACAAGFIPPISEPVNWTTPPLLGGYLATGTWRGVALQVLNLLIAVAVYRPFVAVARKRCDEGRRGMVDKIMATLEDVLPTQGSRVFERDDSVGRLARRLADDLMRDVALGRLRLVYQPQVDRMGTVVGVEALLRWNHKVLGAVPPHIAVMVAEEAGLVQGLGEWIMQTACLQSRAWRQTGVGNPRMSINVSPTQFRDPAFVAKVRAILGRCDVAPGDIEFEITEGRAVAQDELTMKVLEDTAALGIKLAIDDFGMGHSSLLYLRRFSIHAIKLDGSLTRDVLTHATCREIIEAVAHLCRNKRVRVIAEYVETSAQRDLLARLGCDEYQGYLFSKPLEADDVPVYLRAPPVEAEAAALASFP